MLDDASDTESSLDKVKNFFGSVFGSKDQPRKVSPNKSQVAFQKQLQKRNKLNLAQDSSNASQVHNNQVSLNDMKSQLFNTQPRKQGSINSDYSTKSFRTIQPRKQDITKIYGRQNNHLAKKEPQVKHNIKESKFVNDFQQTSQLNQSLDNDNKFIQPTQFINFKPFQKQKQPLMKQKPKQQQKIMIKKVKQKSKQQIRQSLRQQLKNELREELREELKDELREQLQQQIRKSQRESEEQVIKRIEKETGSIREQLKRTKERLAQATSENERLANRRGETESRETIVPKHLPASELEEKVRELERAKNQQIVLSNKEKQKYNAITKEYQQKMTQAEERYQELVQTSKVQLQRIKEEYGGEIAHSENINQQMHLKINQNKALLKENTEINQQVEKHKSKLKKISMKIAELLNQANSNNDEKTIQILTDLQKGT